MAKFQRLQLVLAIVPLPRMYKQFELDMVDSSLWEAEQTCLTLNLSSNRADIGLLTFPGYQFQKASVRCQCQMGPYLDKRQLAKLLNSFVERGLVDSYQFSVAFLSRIANRGIRIVEPGVRRPVFSLPAGDVLQIKVLFLRVPDDLCAVLTPAECLGVNESFCICCHVCSEEKENNVVI